MNLEHLHRDIGRLEGRLEALTAKVNAMDEKLDAVLKRQYRFAGFASVLSAVGASVAAWVLK